MASKNGENQNVNVNIPIGVIATGLILGLAAAAFAMMRQNSQTTGGTTFAGTASGVARGGKGMLRKAALNALIAAIETDASRKLVITVLKAMAKRA